MRNENKVVDYVKYSFWATISFWALSIFIITDSPEATTFEMLFAIGWLITTIFCFVNSIRALCIPKIKKGFLITALVITSFLILSFFVGIVIGLVTSI